MEVEDRMTESVKWPVFNSFSFKYFANLWCSRLPCLSSAIHILIPPQGYTTLQAGTPPHIPLTEDWLNRHTWLRPKNPRDPILHPPSYIAHSGKDPGQTTPLPPPPPPPVEALQPCRNTQRQTGAVFWGRLASMSGRTTKVNTSLSMQAIRFLYDTNRSKKSF